MHGYELTDRGKIALAFCLVIPILILSTLIAFFVFRNTLPEVPPQDELHNISATDPSNAQPQPPENGGFASSDDYDSTDSETDSSASEDDLNDNDSSDDYDINDDDDSIYPENVGSPTVNVSAGRFTFFFSVNNQNSLNNEIKVMLDMFLSSPRNIPGSLIVIETPVLSSDDTRTFMSVMTDALGERNISIDRITHAVDPEIPFNKHFEVNMYYVEIERTGDK